MFLFKCGAKHLTQASHFINSLHFKSPPPHSSSFCMFIAQSILGRPWPRTIYLLGLQLYRYIIEHIFCSIFTWKVHWLWTMRWKVRNHHHFVWHCLGNFWTKSDIRLLIAAWFVPIKCESFSLLLLTLKPLLTLRLMQRGDKTLWGVWLCSGPEWGHKKLIYTTSQKWQEAWFDKHRQLGFPPSRHFMHFFCLHSVHWVLHQDEGWSISRRFLVDIPKLYLCPNCY